MQNLEPLEKIPDYSLYFDVLLLGIILVVGYILVVFYLRYKNKSLTKEELALQTLKNLDTNDTKNTAYLFTKYGRFLANDTKKEEIFERLEEKLLEYKYKKEVKEFDEETLGMIELFLQVVTHE